MIPLFFSLVITGDVRPFLKDIQMKLDCMFQLLYMCRKTGKKSSRTEKDRGQKDSLILPICSGLLNDVQSGFFRPQGPEELYDLSIDPYETVNLVGNDEYSQVLSEMREKLGRKMIDEGDLALVTEAMWLNHVNEI